jgi:hypothetical protein
MAVAHQSEKHVTPTDDIAVNQVELHQLPSVDPPVLIDKVGFTKQHQMFGKAEGRGKTLQEISAYSLPTNNHMVNLCLQQGTPSDNSEPPASTDSSSDFFEQISRAKDSVTTHVEIGDKKTLVEATATTKRYSRLQVQSETRLRPKFNTSTKVPQKQQKKSSSASDETKKLVKQTKKKRLGAKDYGSEDSSDSSIDSFFEIAKRIDEPPLTKKRKPYVPQTSQLINKAALVVNEEDVVCNRHKVTLTGLTSIGQGKQNLLHMFRHSANGNGFMFGHHCCGRGGECEWPNGDYVFQDDCNVKTVHYCLACDTQSRLHENVEPPVFFCQNCYQNMMEDKAAKATAICTNGSKRRSGRSNAGNHSWRIDV